MHLPLTKNFIPNKEASQLSGYNSDYIARLCREGKIEGKRIGRAWFVNRESLQRFIRQQEEKKKEFARELSLVRGREYDARKNSTIEKAVVKSSTPVSARTSRTSISPKLSDIHPTLRPAFALAVTGLVIIFAVVTADAGTVQRFASRMIVAAAVSQQGEVAIPDRVAFAVYRVGDGIARATTFAVTETPRAYREGVLALASTPRDQAAAVATVPATAQHGAGQMIAGATYQSITNFFSHAMDKLAVLLGIEVEHLAVLPFDAASTLHAPTSLPAPVITESGSVTYVGGPVTQSVYSTTYVTGASVDYVNTYVSSYVTTALNDVRQQIAAGILDGQRIRHSTPSTSSGGSASSVSGGTITNSTITGSTFSGGTIVADTLTVSGTTTLSAAATITGPVTFAGITGSTQCLQVDANGVVSGTGSACGAGGGSGITGIKAQYSSTQTGATQTFATSSDTNLQLTITSSGDTHTFTPVWTGVLSVARGGLGLSSVTANQLLIGNSAGTGYTSVATSSLGLSTSDISEGANLYYTLSRFASALAGTTTDALAEGVINKYYTDARARSAFNATATGLSYSTTTGTLSLSSGYEIPLSASTSNWNSFYTTPSTRITAGTNLSWSGNTLNGPSDSYMRSLLAVTSPLSYDNTTGTFSIAKATSLADGYLSAADWSTFNNKVSSTSLSATYPVQYNGSTGVFSLAFGTTTSNTWAGTQTFTNTLATNATTTSLGINNETFTDLTGTGLQNVGGALTLDATGDWTGTFDGQEGSYYLANSFSTSSAAYWLTTKSTSDLAEGSNLYYTDARVNAYINGSTTIPKTYTSNTFTNSNIFNGTLTVGSLNGPLQANGGVVSATTSIGVLYGGTGQTTFTSSQLLYGNGTNALTSVATSSVANGSGISISGSAAVVGAGGLTITNTGVLSVAQSYGSAQTGAITLATSTTGTDFSI
ncbi:MAG: hypothetical protein ACM3TU_03955, partial [Bacillota bacterium]